MKNQNDLIVCIAVFVLGAIAIILCITLQRTPAIFPAPTQVVTSNPQYPVGDVAYTNGLPAGKDVTTASGSAAGSVGFAASGGTGPAMGAPASSSNGAPLNARKPVGAGG